MLQPVAVGHKSLSDYTHIVGWPLIDEIRGLAEPLKGLKVLHLSATAFGGGVSEILYTMVPLMRDVGLDAEWQVIYGREEFFNATKLLHNALQGAPDDLSEEQWATWKKYNEMNARELSSDWDVVIVHDPQPAALHSLVPEKAKHWVWRCHIDLSTPNPATIAHLEPFLQTYPTSVFHMQNYVPAGMNGAVNIVPPAIDPLAPKNMALSPEDAVYVCNQFGLDVDRPLICQVSRFDPWKDPLGVIDAYRIVKQDMPEVQLALVGSMATDDPEGWDFFNATIAHAEGDPDIHILNNFNNVGSIEVNAFQSHSDVLIQKSTREGFGLTVSEAIWKARPMIAGNVGGIPLQIQDGESGYLVDTVEECAARALAVLEDPGLGKTLGLRGKEYVRTHFLMPRLLRDWLRIFESGERIGMTENAPLLLVSNRGPVTFQDDGSMQRGTGGLVTALTGLASHRDAIWIASALTQGDVAAAEERGGRPFEVDAPDGSTYRIRLVASDPDAYERFYSIFANPMLWFIQHYLWDLSNAPDIRRHEVEAFEFGYNVVNEDLARAVLEEIEDMEEPVVMVHDYHLYTLPALVRRARPDVFLHHFIHIPWTQPDAWRVLPNKIREEIYDGVLANDIVGFHTTAYRDNFLQCCRDLFGHEIDFDAGIVRCGDGREVWVRAYPLPIDWRATQATSRRDAVLEHERELLARRRDHLILRVDRADLSKNVLRGFTAFDIFLEQHPQFRERVTFLAQMMPSRTDVAEYAEYLERIEALVAVVNHRHGTPDWMPIQLKLRDDVEEAMAAYKHYDVLLVNAMFDGMNLVAKEGPVINERNGVSILSENTGAHEELGEYALSVNPFDVQELADSIHAALTMAPDERARRANGLRDIVTSRDPGDWIDSQLADIREKPRVTTNR